MGRQVCHGRGYAGPWVGAHGVFPAAVQARASSPCPHWHPTPPLDTPLSSPLPHPPHPTPQVEKQVFVRQPGSLELRPRTVRQLSGGERRRVALALALGFSELAAQRGRLRSSLLVMDEVAQHLDGQGTLRLFDLLKGLPYSSVLVVAQAHSLTEQACDAVDVVVKRGGTSAVRASSGGGGARHD